MFTVVYCVNRVFTFMKEYNVCKMSSGFLSTSLVSCSESELLLVPRPNDNHSPGPVIREVFRDVLRPPHCTELFIKVGWDRSVLVCCLAHRGSTVDFLLLQCSSGGVRHPRDFQVSVATRCFCRVIIFVSS